MTFAPGCNDVSLITARPNNISGAPKLHSQVNPTKSICPFQYLEIINFSKPRYYKRKLLVNLFSHRSGWMRSLPALGTLKGQGGHFIFPCIPNCLVGRLQGNTRNAVGSEERKAKGRLTRTDKPSLPLHRYHLHRSHHQSCIQALLIH